MFFLFLGFCYLFLGGNRLLKTVIHKPLNALVLFFNVVLKLFKIKIKSVLCLQKYKVGFFIRPLEILRLYHVIARKQGTVRATYIHRISISGNLHRISISGNNKRFPILRTWHFFKKSKIFEKPTRLLVFLNDRRRILITIGEIATKLLTIYTKNSVSLPLLVLLEHVHWGSHTHLNMQSYEISSTPF